MLRERYGNFLGNQYKPSILYGFSSYKDRTKESMELVLASLFPPTDDLRWNSELNWIPIAFDSLPPDLDILLHSYHCEE